MNDMEIKAKNLLTPIIKESYTNGESPPKPHTTYLRASGLLGRSMKDTCPRQLYWRMTTPKPFELETLQIFKVGHVLHEFVQDNFKNIDGIEFISEEENVNITEPIEIHGRLDARIKVDGTEYIVEIKSISQNGLNFLRQVGCPKEQHYSQVQYYMYATGVKDGILLYFDKQSGDYLDYHVGYDQNYIDWLLEYHAKHLENIKSETLPPKMAQFKFSSYPCNYCEFKPECKDVEKKNK